MSPARHPVRALVLTPTRELADQVANNVKTYAKHTQLRSTVVFGGIDMKPQTAELKRGVEVLIATPGRLLDHIEAKNCVLNQVEYVVLDEADRMLDIGFLPDLQRILSYLPKQRQTLLFSATFSPEIKRLAESYIQDPILHEVARPNPTATNVDVGGWFLTDDAGVPMKFRIPDGTMINAGSFAVFTEAQFNATPGTNGSFSLNSSGEEVYLFSGDAGTNLTGYSHGLAFGAAAAGVPFGRHVNSVGEEQFPAQLATSLNAVNAGPRVGPVVINEIHYNPAPGEPWRTAIKRSGSDA